MLKIVAASAAVAAMAAYAQDEDFDFGDDFGDDSAEAVDAVDSSDESTSDESEEAAEEGDSAGEEVPAKKSDAKSSGKKHFTALPFCRRASGAAEVLAPGAEKWTAVEDGKFYPLGSAFRTKDNSSYMKIVFGPDDASVEINGAASGFSTAPKAIGEESREITLQSGVITLKLPRNLPEGLFMVTAPGFTVKNPQGISRYAYKRTVDGDVAQVRCVTGNLAIEGRHFEFPQLKAANEVKIRSSQDQLFTGLYGKSGDCLVKLDQGDTLDKEFNSDGTVETKVVRKPLEWKLSPKTAARIYRAVPSIGERMAVTVMTFTASGALKNRCAFVEGRPEVNTGELGPAAEAMRDDMAKKAAEAADAQAVDVDVDVEADEGDAGDSADPSSGETPSEDSSGGDDFEF